MAENFESVKLRCLVDTERAKRDDCPPLDEELREAVIRLAYRKPELRADLLPLITDHTPKTER